MMKKYVSIRKILCSFLFTLVIMTAGSIPVHAASIINGSINGCFNNSEYDARVKIGDYYLWQKYKGTDASYFYYAKSKKGKAIKIDFAKYCMDENVAVSGTSIYYAPVNERNINGRTATVYKYDTKSGKSKKIVKLKQNASFLGVYGDNAYCVTDNGIYYAYSIKNKKWKTLLKLKGAQYPETTIYNGKYLIAGVPGNKIGGLYVLDISKAKAIELADYCYGGKSAQWGYRVFGSKVYFRAFLNKGETYKNRSSYIFTYDLKTGKFDSLFELDAESLIDNIVLVSKDVLYFHSAAKNYAGYYSFNYSKEQIKVISKSTFTKAAAK